MSEKSLISTIILLLILAFYNTNLKGQNVPVHKPNKIGWELDFNEDLISKFNSSEAIPLVGVFTNKSAIFHFTPLSCRCFHLQREAQNSHLFTHSLNYL